MTLEQIRQVVGARARSRYWRRSDAEVIVAALLHSGMTLSAFAREFGICVQRLRRWKRKLAEDEPEPDDEPPALPMPGFRPVHVVVGDPAETRNTELELVTRSGRRIIVGADFDERSLERLVRFVERLGC